MSRHRTLIFAGTALSAALWALSCGDGATEPPPDPPRPTTVTVSPATAELTALGATVQLSAQVLDQYGQVMAGAAVSWSSSAASVAAVDASGLVTAVANGTATITATAGSASGTATVTVAQQVSTVAVAPAADTVVERDTVRFEAEARDANGHAVAGAAFTWASGDTSVAVVDASGLVTGTGEGEVEVAATSSGVTGRAELVVEALVPTTVSVAPSTLAFTALGDTVRLMAEVRDQIDRVMEGEPVAWTSAEMMVAAVDSTGLVTAVANGTATITATAGSASGTATVTVAQQVSTVAVAPAADTVVERDTVRFEAEARDANGHAVAGAAFTWASGDTSVAVVDASGLVTGTGEGEVEVAATSSGVTGRAELVVEALVPTTVSVAPSTLAFTALGDTVRLMAEVRDQIDRVMEGEPVAWTSAEMMVAAVDSTGLVTAVANGAATITAMAGSASGTAAVTVAQRTSTVEVAPAATTVVERDTVRFEAEARDANGHAVAAAAFTWASGDTSVAVVDASGLVTGAGAGEVEVAATSSGVTGRAELVVEALVPTTVSVAPSTLAFTALGDTVRLMAEVRDQIDRVMEGEPVSWASGDTMVATVDSTGLVTAVANGAATITAMAGSASGTAAVTVAQLVSTVEVAPAADTVVERDTVRFEAEAMDANGHAVAGAAFTWASGDTSVAVVDASGLVTGTGAGAVEVTATASGVTGRAELTVVAPAPTAIAVTPDTVALTALGQTVQLAAEVLDQAGRVMEGEPVSWASGDTMVATVDGSGLVGAAANGAATITATAGSASGEAVVTVMQSAGSVVVSPAAATVPLGDTVRLTAEVFDENGHRVAGAEFSWSSSDVSVAAVDASGLVRGDGEGTATITATAGDAMGTSEITVENPDRASLVALYEATDGPNWVNSDNWLTGAPLGEWYGVGTDRSGRVVWLGLVGNDLTGPIPPELGNLANLRRLLLYATGVSGPIPPELGNLASLTSLDLRINQLSGPIPPELGNLANLTDLLLSSNQLTGPIPPELGNLANLTSLDLYHNDLTGPIPPELGNLAHLTSLDLGANQLTGPILPELGNLANLTSLNLSFNQLSGLIPPELGNLASLERLFLLGNRLSGPIPRSFLALDRLEYFTFFQNAGLCAPGTLAFVTWRAAISSRGPYCNELDAAVLDALYQVTGGPDWTISDGWLVDAPALDEWYGVTADSLGRVVTLDLTDNGLAGPLPSDLGNLREMTRLRIGNNALSGRLPISLARLSLVEFRYIDTGLCTPAETEFRAWLIGIPLHAGTGVECAAISDRDILVALYNGTGGPGWTRSDNWLTDSPLGSWYGVSVDAEGRVVDVDLSSNNLTGPIPPELGNLANLTSLTFDSNNFTGPIPPELGNLANLRRLSLYATGVSGPIPPELGNLANLMSLTLDSNNLTGPIPPELGNLANLRRLSLYATGVSGPIPPELGNLVDLETLRIGHSHNFFGGIPAELGTLANLRRLELFQSRLTGPIPPELGALANLEWLSLFDNDLTGPVPPELGALANLEWLSLFDNDLTGPLPSELGNLANLRILDLRDNKLTGPLPPQLGNLTNLRTLSLADNNLIGPLPSELGNLASLEGLSLDLNDLSGPVPPEFSRMSSLQELTLANNARMAGALPSRLTDLGRLEHLLAGGTNLCAPSDPGFQAWLERVHKRRIAPCLTGNRPMAYLTQAVQSREFPVPLVADEKALLRVFVTARKATSEGIPPVRARFYVNSQEVHVKELPRSSAPIPTAVDESSLSKSANGEIPGHVIQPGLEMVIEIDPDGTLDPELGVPKRIPETGRMAVDVREMPLLDLTVIPFLWTADPDSAIIDLTAGMATDPEGDDLLQDTRTLLPVASLEVRPHEPVLSSRNNPDVLLRATEAIRAMEGGVGHYLGMMSETTWGPVGIASAPGRSSFATPSSRVIAHELGHNLSLFHAPCGDPDRPDLSFPYPDGSIGAWGYDFRDGGRLVRPSAPDLMSYCGPWWMSDYHFTNALRFRLSDAERVGLPDRAPATKALLLWGGVSADSVPFLEPAFVVDARPELPRSGGEYRLTGRNGGDDELFSISFAMPNVADGDGSSSFAFVLPVRSEWEDSLATITLSGPGGSFTLDADSDLSVTILRNPRNGQVRGILRDLPDPAMAAALATGPGLEVLFSRGIPEAAAWRR